MSRPRFFADEDLRGSIVRAVRRMTPEVEIKTVIEQGLSSASDDNILEFAWRERWLIVSHDVGTLRSLAEQRVAAGKGCHGVFPQNRSTRSIAELLSLIWDASEFEEWQNRIVYLPF